MENNEDLKMEQIVNKMFKDAPLEHPSVDFTTLVMEQIETASQPSLITTYKPLIPKSIKYLITAFGLALIVYILWFNTNWSFNWFSTLDLSLNFNTNMSSGIQDFNISNTAIYGVLILMAFGVTQLSYLKHYFNKQLAI